MPDGLNVVGLAVPVFALAILAEWALQRRRRPDAYHLGTAISDIGCGASYQVLELFLRVFTIAAYEWIFAHWRLVEWGEGSAWPWVIGLVGVDLGYYVWHRISHVVNAMWAVHAVHHQSEDYNFAVALRQPLLEPLSWAPFFTVLALLGVPAEVYLASFAFNLLYQFWLHTELVQHLPRPLEWILNTPSHHRVHHGIEPEYLDKNYGGVLIVWDRLFGTFEPERRTPTYGTTIPLRSYDPLYGNAAHWIRIWRLSRAARSTPERLWAWVAHPAWLPHGVTLDEDKLRRGKYRPSVSAPTRRYAVLQTTAVTVVTGVLVTFEANLQVRELAVAACVLAVAWVSVTARLERHPWAGRLDWVRLASLGALTGWLTARHICATWGVVVALGLGLISVLARPRT